MVGVLPIQWETIFLSGEGPMLETLDYTIRIGSTPTFLYFYLYKLDEYKYHCFFIVELFKEPLVTLKLHWDINIIQSFSEVWFQQTCKE